MTAIKSTKGDSRISTSNVLEEINKDRRRFVGTAAMTIAAAQLGILSSADAQPPRATSAGTTSSKRGTNTSFGSPEADRCRPAQRRLRRSRSRRWSRGHSSARLAVRHLQLCRRRSFVGIGRLPRDSCRICAAMARRVFSPVKRFAMASRPWSLSTSSL